MATVSVVKNAPHFTLETKIKNIILQQTINIFEERVELF